MEYKLINGNSLDVLKTLEETVLIVLLRIHLMN